MKNNILNIYVITMAAFALSSCANIQLGKLSNYNDTINIDKAIYKDSILISDIVSVPKVIILESTKECLIQKIRSMEVYDNKLYILDDKTNSLFVFAIDGTFLGKIGDKGRGNGEYWDLADFTIDRENGFIYLWDEALNVINKYNIQTRRYISSTKVENDGDRSFCVLYYNGKMYINRTTKGDDDDSYELMELDLLNGQQTGSYLKSSEYNHGWNYPFRLPCSYFYSKNSDSPKYIEMFSDKIMSITSGGISPSILVQSKDFVNETDIKLLKEKTQKSNYMYNLADLNEKGRVYMIYNYAELNNFVTFHFAKGWEILTAFYDPKKEKLFVTNNVENDYIGVSNSFASDFIYTDENGAYSLIDTDILPIFIDEIINEKKLNPEIDKYDKLMKISPESNPIVFFYPYNSEKSQN